MADGDVGGGRSAGAGFEGSLVDRFVLAGSAAGISDRSLAEDRSVLLAFAEVVGCRLWAVQAADVDRYLVDLRERGCARSTVYDRANTVSRFYAFLLERYQQEVYVRTGCVVVQPVDEFNRPRHGYDHTVRIPPAAAEVAALFDAWRRALPAERKYLPAARNYMAASLWRRVGLRRPRRPRVLRRCWAER
ncbi:hypothetical protein [Streptomyces sp. NPDC018036]|uniref:hypothetical protein n=1 Tax=Streptomyces sp. NPDC018036 TaxID=3365035 RepID=UPI0037BCC664